MSDETKPAPPGAVVDGRLTPQLTEKLHAHLRSKWGEGRKCPMCGTAKWVTGYWSQVYLGPLLKSTSNVPVTTIICNNCGYVVLMSTKIAGLSEIDDV